MNAGSFNRGFARAWLVLGYAFLYMPIVALVAYSFNDSPVAEPLARLHLEVVCGARAPIRSCSPAWPCR